MQRTYNYLNHFFNNLQSQGRYTFTLKELKNEFEVSDEALKSVLPLAYQNTFQSKFSLVFK